jgi:uncharacterized membrane-anchored protein YhcB (DUF1043 family)
MEKENYWGRISLICLVIGIVFGFLVYIETKWQVKNQLKVNKESYDVVYLTNTKYVFAKSRFITVGHACGSRESVTSFQSSDGIYLYRTWASYSSSSLANITMRKKLKKSKFILEDNTTYDKDGNNVGRRVIAIFISEKRQQIYSILWTYQNRLIAIFSPSLQQALILEKDTHSLG